MLCINASKSIKTFKDLGKIFTEIENSQNSIISRLTGENIRKAHDCVGFLISEINARDKLFQEITNKRYQEVKDDQEKIQTLKKCFQEK